MSESNGESIACQPETRIFEGNEVRTTYHRGERFWIVMDLCRCLGRKRPHLMVRGLDPSEYEDVVVATEDGPCEFLCVKRGGMLQILMRRPTNISNAFKAWIIAEYFGDTSPFNMAWEMATGGTVGPVPSGPELEPESKPSGETVRSIATELVPFYGDMLEFIETDHGVFVSIRRCCENMELDVTGQLAKLREKSWATIEKFSMVASDGRVREMAMVHIDSLPLWLATIDEARVPVGNRAKLICYQKEAAKALADHVYRRHVPPTGMPPTGMPELAAIFRSLAPVLAKLPEFLDCVINFKNDIAEARSTFADHDMRMDEIEDRLPPPGYATLVAFTRFKNLKDIEDEELRNWGGQLKSYCRKLGIETKPVEDKRWGIINSYPIRVLEDTFDRFGPRDKGSAI